MTTWRLEVLGTAALEGDGKILHPERKTVALLTYLALEGATPRSKIAGLLWPDSGENTARSNLRQVLSRLKKSTNAELVTADDLLKVQGLEVDAAKLKVLAFSNSDEALQSTGNLLAPHDYDDCPDFADWLFSERERIQVFRQNALNSKIKTLEQTANYSEALSYAQKLLELEPLAEEVHRQMMRLHYLTGDRAAALAAFERCKNVLQKELGVEPLAETLKLVSEIEFGALLPTALPNKQKTDLPLRVLRPPMVGREEAWQRMSEAWHNHQVIFISGVPGVGKSRLMQEFVVASQKPHCLFEARLGDANVPYATNTRNFRKMLSEFPVTLEAPLKRELARILSELGDAPAPISNESELVRFYDAQEKTVRLAMEAGLAGLAYDDVQYVDAASIQGWLHSSANHIGKPDGIKLIASFRKGELSGETQKSVDHLVSSGLAVLIELEPLPEQDVSKLIDNLGITDLQPLAAQLSRYTGGNPLFIVETIKHLIESEQLGTGTFALPTTGKVFALLKDRLGRLSTEAQRLVWTAAIAQSEFSLELASSILAKSPFDLAEPFEELETTNIFSGLRFSHDLLFETALTTIPSPIKVYLHRRCAEELEKTQASPATIAEHWLSAGDEEKAVPKLLEAAENQFQLGLLGEAIKTLELATTISSSGRDQAITILAVRYMMANKIKKAEMLALSTVSSKDKVACVTALKVLSEVRTEQGRFEEALALVEEGIVLSERHSKETLLAFQGQAADLSYYLGDIPKAIHLYEQIRSQCSKDNEKADYLSVIMSLSTLYQGAGDKEKSKALEEEAYQLAYELNSGLHLVQLASNYLLESIEAGKPELGIARAEEALGLGEFLVSQRLRVNLAIAYQELNRLQEAIKLWNELTDSENETYQGIAFGNLSILCHKLGNKKDAGNFLEKAFALAKNNANNSLNATVLCALLTQDTLRDRKRAATLRPKVNIESLSTYRRREVESLLSKLNVVMQEV
jgi:DNA-binding SARP family transcriptional activator/predicted ATPase